MENLTLWYHLKTGGLILWSHQKTEDLMLWYRQKIKEVQFYRIGILAFTLLVQANIIIPVTLLAISMGGGSSFAFACCTFFSFLILVSQLAVMPAKITIPLFIVSTIVQGFIIAVSIM